ncbi:glycoside hydrolase family 3 protein [Nocardioides sp. Iso805N]|uniref:glycoside hydrolase family 3 protein n=1 Tax=Nocardioides sp. Iso805N TaxID=1283287 RepID=UPI00036367B3|nr:glycoside hydrolase family 3 protein [Nocardioides sp. Iso805N]
MPHHIPTSGRVVAAGAAGVLALGVLAAGSPAVARPAPQHHGQHQSQHQQSHKPAYKNPRLPVSVRVRDLLSRMTLAEKIGQMTQAERADVTADPTLVAQWNLGSVLSGGGSVPTPNTPTAFADMVDGFQAQALKTRLGIPLLYGIDAVHGDGNIYGSTVFPHDIGLGATRDPKLVEKVEHVTAIETRASGPNWAFAPCICVARDDRWGRTYESFGESPKLVERMETAIDGFQGKSVKDLSHPDHVLATAKHFAGDGLTTYDASKAGTGAYPIDQGVDQVSKAQFAQLALAPYVPAIKKHHVQSVMPSFSSVDFTNDGLGNPVKMSANKALITGWLKNQQRFKGLVISDWQAIRQLPGTYSDQVATGVNAGIDMFMEPYSGSATGAPQFEATLTSLVNDGTVSMARINDAVSRILRVKFELGLFEHPYTNRSLANTIGDKAHHEVARQAAAESQVLLTNKSRTLPLKPGRHPVYVAGSNADNIGNQAGGWTLTWQGGSTNVIPGTTILDGIEAEAKAPVTYSVDASTPVPAGADGIVVVGETPYAEGYGDVGGPQWAFDPGDNNVPRPAKTMMLSDADTQAIKTVCAAARSCTVVVISGRPMIIPPDLLGQIDSLVAGWLPGSEGIGVADDLFGHHRFTGKLPVSWPRTVAQEPINVGDANYNPLFRFGYGLRD